jgi:predicted nucleotidyltransferase
MGLLKQLKSDENARKIFGKAELKIIEKQLLGINLTQSEKNRLSRDIRKKLEFIKKIANFSEEFELKKGAEIKKMITEAKAAILNDMLFNKIKRIIIFGSVIENKLTFKSDIDVAVEFTETNLKEATLFRKRISGRINPRIDIQVYNILPEKIKREIQDKGKNIYENENK